MKRLLAFLFLLFLAVSVPAEVAASAPTGFRVAGSTLLAPSGAPFVIRGINRLHWDSYGNPTDAQRMGANTVRLNLNLARPAAGNLLIAQSYAALGIVPMPGNWGGTCKADTATLSTIVDTWVAQASTWTQLNSNGLINIANEWGPANSTVWRDSYITAIARMRAAGYTGTLVIDSGGCGQDAQDVVKYGAAVLAADPMHNLLFDLHVYGSWHYPATATWQQDYATAMRQLKASGLPILLGEFGPGRNIGPSPTLVTPAQVMGDAERNGFSWLAWAADDVDLPNCAADDAWFSLTVKCGVYTGVRTDLTLFGSQVVPVLQALARPAGI
jgi:mannan endo-1,4-beta-mannosidase